MQPAIFLDRDNTLIANDGDLGDPEQVRLVEGVADGLRRLRESGYSLIVVTNQAGVARGKFTEEGVDAVHQRIAMLVDDQAQSDGLIDRFYYCPYHPEATVPEYRRDHPWRKPHPGMILQAARDMELDLSQSWMIGDQERDIQAGRAAGCRTVLVTRDAGLAERVKPTDVAGSFQDAVRRILQQNGQPISTLQPGTAARRPAPTPLNPNAAQSNQRKGGDSSTNDLAGIRRAVLELSEEIRSDRLRRSEFTFLRMVAGVCQLLAVLLALLGLLQLTNTEVFAKWMIGAGLVQLVTITLLIVDLKS